LRPCHVFFKIKVDCTMKNPFRILIAFMVISIVVGFSTVGFSQPPPPPPPTIGHGAAGNVPGGGAPIGEGIYFLLGLAGLYGGAKVYEIRKSLKKKAA
jgi:hypothetical protein